MEKVSRHLYEIRGVYDGICVEYYPETKEFVWREVAIQRTTEEYRKQFETNILKEESNL